MLLVIIAVLVFVVGIVWRIIDRWNEWPVVFIGLGCAILFAFLIAIPIIQAYGITNASGYENDIAYIKSYDGVELSPRERVTVLQKVNYVNGIIISNRVWVDNLFLNWFVSKPVAQLDLIEYDFDQSVFNVKVVE